MIRFTITWTDLSGRFAAQADTIQANVLAAANNIARWVPGNAEIAIDLIVDPSVPTANGGAVAVVPTGIDGGVRVVMPGMAYEIATGTDPNGDAPDARIRVGADALASMYWIDPTPATRDDIPSAGYDFLSGMEHELLHALAFQGYRNGSGALTASVETPYDRWVQASAGRTWFIGPTARAVYGGDVPLSDAYVYHYAYTTDARTGLLDGVMNGNGRNRGVRYDLNDLDLAMLQDSGVRIEHTARGTDGADSIASPLQGTFFGLGGNDSIRGSALDDNIDGGAGVDTAVYGGVRSSYRITATATGYTVQSSTEGNDHLAGIERLLFADGSVAYDLDGHAGVAARVVGALLGHDMLANRPIVGIALGLLDGGMSEQQLAALAVGHALFAGLAGSHSNTDFVNFVYRNVTGGAPDAQTLASLVGLLDNGSFTQASMAVLAAEHPLNASGINLVGLAQTGLGYT